MAAASVVEVNTRLSRSQGMSCLLAAAMTPRRVIDQRVKLSTRLHALVDRMLHCESHPKTLRRECDTVSRLKYIKVRSIVNSSSALRRCNLGAVADYCQFYRFPFCLRISHVFHRPQASIRLLCA